MRLAVDAMGGDNAPAAVVEGSVKAAKAYKVEIVLVGRKDDIQHELNKYSYPNDLISIHHASEIILMDESPVAAIKQKKDSSINVAINLLKTKQVDAVISSGNTGAYMTSALLNIGRIHGIERPAIATLIPTHNSKTMFLDMGANVDCKPKHLYQFSLMGNVFAKEVLGIAHPKIALLNIGEEEEKGNELTFATYKLLKASKEINFIGNIEGKDVLTGRADIIICDGFVGNMLLKFGEGLGLYLGNILKKEIKNSIFAKIGAIFLYPSLQRIRKFIDYDEYGGALLLGINGICIKAHGRANEKAFQNAIKVAIDSVDHKIIDIIKKSY